MKVQKSRSRQCRKVESATSWYDLTGVREESIFAELSPILSNCQGYSYTTSNTFCERDVIPTPPHKCILLADSEEISRVTTVLLLLSITF
mmetsp:Transcript_17975/g.41102  ORF Transcript_17975/g.41102 Transcript_17975/m.41102 type:complete len:90 (+) Transcript_17975:1900-2169(+)